MIRLIVKGLRPNDVYRLAKASGIRVSYPSGILANHSLDVVAVCGIVDPNTIAAVKYGQAIVAVFGAWFDNELHGFLNFFYGIIL